MLNFLLVIRQKTCITPPVNSSGTVERRAIAGPKAV
jgi:hypothetical protein